MKSFRLPAPFLLVWLAACATDQQRDVDAWREQVALGPAPQWTPGTPLSLATAVRLAVAGNERLGIGGEDFVQACAARARIGAGFLPSADLAPNYTFRDKSDSGVKFLDQTSLLDVPVRAQFTLFEGFRNNARATAASLTVEQKQAILRELRETVVLEVVQAYYRVLRAERRQALFAASLAVQEQRQREIVARERLGTARALDRSSVEAQLARIRVDRITAESDAVAGRAALSQLLAADASGCPLQDDFVLPADRPNVDALFAVAEARRQDLRAAALAAEVARARVEVAFGQYYPSIGVNLDWFVYRESLPTDRDWTGLLTLNLPLFAGGRIAADVQEAWSVFRQEVLRYSLLRRQIRNDLVAAVDKLGTFDRRLQELRTQVAADTAAAQQAAAGRRHGLATELERITAEDQQRRGENDVAEGELLRKVAWFELLRDTGALTAGAVDVQVPPTPPPRPAPQSPFVLPAARPAAGG